MPSRDELAKPSNPAHGSPIEVRLIGHEDAVRRLVEALTTTAGPSAGPVSYRPSRHGNGTRAYLTLAVPTQD